MLKKACFVLLLPLASCAWNPVITPYAYGQKSPSSASETATIWGMVDGKEMYFREIDGKSLPSRGGGGYPISLSLLPGSYTVEIYFNNVDYRYAVVNLPIRVEAGHTYVVEHEISSDDTRVILSLKDLGTTTKCNYDRYNQLRGNAKLICQ